MITDQRLLSSLQKAIEREISLYEQYTTVLEEERKNITKFNSEKIEECTAKRESLHEAMKEAHERRLEIVEAIPDSKGIRLTDLIDQQCLASDRRRLLPLAQKLRSLVESTHDKTREGSSVVRFAMGVVDSLVSIFWSSTQHITRSYSRQGKLQEKTQPPGDRRSSVLKSA